MICKERDDFIEFYFENNPAWWVVLNSGETVYQDDGRPGADGPAWLRLKQYCLSNNLYIKDMNIGFRCNKHVLPSDKDGYYFSKGVRGGFGMPKTHQLFYVGYVENDTLYVTTWKVPEMLPEHTEERILDLENICLISKNILPS